MRIRALAVDLEGTVTEDGILNAITQKFAEPHDVAPLSQALRAGTLTMQQLITQEFALVRAPLDAVVAFVLSNVTVRPGFRELVTLSRERSWEFVIVSDAFVELIEPILACEGVSVEVRANSVVPSGDGWQVNWRASAACGICGEACKRSSLPQATELVYIGDGLSDRCAALATAHVFATGGLADYLDQAGVAYQRFADFFDVARALVNRG